MKRKRLWCWTLGAVFVAACCWRVFCVPYDPIRVFSAMPGDAMFVTAHDDLGKRWGDLSSSKAIGMVFGRLSGPGRNRVGPQDPETRKWIERVAGKRVAVGYVPALGGTGPAAWVMTSWVGGYARWFRWAAAWNLIPGIERIGSHARRPVFRVKSLSGRMRPTLSIAVGNGVIMCCRSGDPQGVRHLINCLDRVERAHVGRRDSLLSDDAAPGAGFLWTTDAPDRAWTRRLPGISGKSHRLVFSGLKDDKATITLEGLFGLFKEGGLDESADLDGLTRIFGDLPDAAAILPSSALLATNLNNVLGVPRLPEWWDALSCVLETTDTGTERWAFACLLGGEYCGRMKSIYPDDYPAKVRDRGVAIPAFVVAIQVKDGRRAKAAMVRVIEELNRRHKLGLCALRAGVRGQDLMVIESTGSNGYAKLGVEERVGYAVFGNWLVVSSNLGTLTKLGVRLSDSVATGSGGVVPRWRTAFEATSHASAQLWCDSKASAETIGNGTAVWRMALGESPKTRRFRHRLTMVDEVFADLAQFKQLRVTSATSGDLTTSRLSLGTSP